jgi:hypothetical protein
MFTFRFQCCGKLGADGGNRLLISWLWTGFGALGGAELGMACAWAADYGRRTRRAWLRRYAIGLGLPLGAAIGAALSVVQPPETWFPAASPALQALHDRYPGVVAQMAEAIQGVRRSDEGALQGKMRPILANLLAAHRHEIDDDSAVAIGQLMLDETQALREAQPEACVALLGGRHAGVDLRAMAGPELRRRDAEVTARLVEQLSTRPAPPPAPLSAEAGQRLTDHALAKLTSGERDAVTPLLLAHREPATPQEADVLCAFERARISAALDASPATMRSLLAG